MIIRAILFYFLAERTGFELYSAIYLRIRYFLFYLLWQVTIWILSVHFFVRTCLKEPLLHCKYKYSFLFTQIILIFLYTKVFDWLLFGGSCLI